MLRFLSLFIALLIPTILHAECTGNSDLHGLAPETAAALQARAAQAPYSEGILWRVEKNGHVSYIVGTLHVAAPGHARTMTTLKSLPDLPNRLFLELSKPDETAFMAHLTANPSLMLITEGPTLIDQLGEGAWNKLVPRLQAIGLPPFMAAQYQPWFLGLALSVPPCALQAMMDGQEGLDRQIEHWALENGAPVASLDTAEQLVDILASDPIEEQVDTLKWALSLDVDTFGTSELPTLIALYFEERTQLSWEYTQHEALSPLTTPQDRARAQNLFDEMQSGLIETRNQAWVDQLVPELSSAPALIAFGALHLPGPKGVLALLEQQGFAVTRVPLGQ